MSRSIAALLKVAEPDRDMDWLEESLQSAVKLEFATIPLYLSSLWSVQDPPPGPPQGSSWPSDVLNAAYAVLRGIAVSDFADVLFRAAAFAHVVATGRAVLDVPAAEASRMRTLADQLESAARQELAQQLG